jgi:DNA-binding transcriptional ArsR family regulator
MRYILDKGQCTFYDIVNHSERAPSTISWHLSRLRDNRLIISTSRNPGGHQAYKIIKRDLISRILSKYTRKFV